MPDLWIASDNRKKRAELERVLSPLGIGLKTPADLGDRRTEFAPVEDQPDFAGNARKKAQALAKIGRGWTLADDSGLCVDALEGRPGVLSARYGGAGLDDRGRVSRLLEELAAVPPAQRTAHFVCSLCVCDGAGTVRAAIEERCEGTLLLAPSGEGGFGYDPIFVPTKYEGDPARAFARLDAAEKDLLSHRGKALRGLLEVLPDLLASG